MVSLSERGLLAGAVDPAARRYGVVVSFALHLAAATALLIAAPTGRPLPSPPPPIPVKLVTREQFETATRATVTAKAPDKDSELKTSNPARQAGVPRTSPKLPGAADAVAMIRPQHMLSDEVLADPRNAKAKRQMRTFAAGERVIQLCNLEAMQQLHGWKAEFRPETVVAYAMQDLKIAGPSIIADGAAFYSEHKWYALRFQCDVQGDKVTAFAFLVGQVIPRSQWEGHNLSEQIADD